MEANNIEEKSLTLHQVLTSRLNFMLCFANILEGFYNVFYSLDLLSGSRRPFETNMWYSEGPVPCAVSLNEGKVLYVVLASTVSFR